jgi:thiol-disulfide isomerase/thioredoxin
MVLLGMVLGWLALPVGAAAQQAPRDLLSGGVGWINVAGPIHLSQLRGKVVLLDFWTYCCINCHHVLPDLAYLEEKYKNELVVIGVHSAKFLAEQDTENIRKKVAEYRIKHPVINDANHVLWTRFGVNSWPTLALINPAGEFVDKVAGEGNRDLLDRAIGQLIAEARAKGLLDERPLKFFPESEKPHKGPLLYPGKVFADQAGNRLFIADTGHNRIVITDLAGKGIATVGTGAEGFTNGGYDRATFNRPQGICLVGETLYVADTENHAIRAIDLKEEHVTTIAGTGQQARGPGGHGPGKSTRLSSPWDVVQIPGTHVLAIAMAGMHQIWRLDLKSGNVAAWAGSGLENIIDGPLGAACLAQPSGLATDGYNLFIADSEASALRAIPLDKKGNGHSLITIIGVMDDLFKFGDVDGHGSSARLQHCLGVTFANGTLFVADTYNNKIKACSPKARTVRTFVGNGRPGIKDNPPEFDEPGGLSAAGSTLFVADTNNHAIRTIDLETKAVATLKLTDVAPPVLKPKPPSFPNKLAIELPSTAVAPGQSLALDVELKLPKGFELNPEAPMPYLVETPGKSGILSDQLPPEGSAVEKPSTQFTIEVPLAQEAKPGAMVPLRLSVAAYICKEGQGGLCTVRSYVWDVPLVVTEGAPSRVALTAPSKAEPGR